MSVDIGESFRDGARQLLGPRGIVVGGLLLLMGIGNLFIQQSIQLHVQRWMIGFMAPEANGDAAAAQMAETIPFALDVALPLLLAMVLVVLLVNELVRLVGIRMFASDSREPIPFDDVTRDFGDAAIKALVIGGVFALVITLVNLIPLLGQLIGWVLVLLFVYLRQVIALEDLGFVETISESFELFMEDPVPIAVILFVLGLVGAVVTTGIPMALNFTVFSGMAPGSDVVAGQGSQAVTSLLGTVLGVIFQTLGIAVVTSAYLQVRDARDAAEAEPV